MVELFKKTENSFNEEHPLISMDASGMYFHPPSLDANEVRVSSEEHPFMSMSASELQPSSRVVRPEHPGSLSSVRLSQFEMVRLVSLGSPLSLEFMVERAFRLLR